MIIHNAFGHNIEQNSEELGLDFARNWLQIELPQKENVLKGMLHFRQFGKNPQKPSMVEIYLEFLMLGTFLNIYISELKKNRNRYAPYLSLFRNLGGLFENLRGKGKSNIPSTLARKNESVVNVNMKDFKLIVKALSVSNTYKFEFESLTVWKKYLNNIPKTKANSILNIARLSALSFLEMAERIFPNIKTERADNESQAASGRSLAQRIELKYLNNFYNSVFILLNQENSQLKQTWAM